MLIEASITAGIRPTSMILHTQPGKKWNKFDFLCIEAHQIVVNERCPQCGLPRWVCHNEDGDIGFRVVKDICYAKREIETVDESDQKQKKYKAPKGVMARPEPFRYSGEPIDGDVREAYYRREFERKVPDSEPNVA